MGFTTHKHLFKKIFKAVRSAAIADCCSTLRFPHGYEHYAAQGGFPSESRLSLPKPSRYSSVATSSVVLSEPFYPQGLLLTLPLVFRYCLNSQGFTPALPSGPY